MKNVWRGEGWRRETMVVSGGGRGRGRRGCSGREEEGRHLVRGVVMEMMKRMRGRMLGCGMDQAPWSSTSSGAARR